ncbi:MAG TPA: hypothetical protein VGF76_24165 [Polyangiaceae bacterium]|jgi:hypothetical protein|nr:hypothetical protein [Polyangiaceae bacterium]
MDKLSGWERFRRNADEVVLLVAAVGIPAFVAWRCRHETWVAVMIVIDVLGILVLVLQGQAKGNAWVFPVVIGWLFAIVVKPILMLIAAVHRVLGG